jgi:hypothetical protein
VGNARHAFLARIGEVGSEAALLEVPEEHRDACAALPLDDMSLAIATGLAAEVAFAYDVARGTAREIGRDIGRAYGELGTHELAGTADVIGLDAERVLVIDWKSIGSRDRARDSIQLRLLALAASRAYGRSLATVEIVKLGDGGEVYRSRHEYDELDLDTFALELRAWHEGAAAGGDLSEGSWCDRCPSYSHCPAKSALAVQLAAGEAMSIESMLPLTPERAGIAWSKLRSARTLLAHIERAVVATLDENGGSLPLPGGRELRRVAKPGVERLDGAVVHQAVAELYGREVADRAVEMAASKASIKRAIGPLDTKRGALVKAETAVLDKVRAAGGASRKPTSSIEECEAAP